jgi:hypothetical protein
MAIVTDKLKLLNCTNFINDVSNNDYYIFIGLPNAQSFYPNWDSSRPDPTDNFLYLNSYRDNILGVKKITSSNVIRVIPKNTWTYGKRYDMYRHDYGVYNQTPATNSTRLYDSLYYVVNSEYRVYICINNGSSPTNQNKGIVSTQEPLHTDLEPQEESDGYSWKYLYTLSPADVLKYDSTDYISVPNNWKTSSNSEISRIRDNATSGKIEVILIQDNNALYNINGTITNVPIKGDGIGGTASVTFGEDQKPLSVDVTNGGSGYTFATLDLDSIIPSSSANKAIFNVIIPPPGGHGKDVYTELGAHRVLIYSRIENDSTNPDFIVGNQFSRIGIIKGLTPNGIDDQSDSKFSDDSGSGVYGIKLLNSVTSFTEPYDSTITQENSNAIGNLVSFDITTKILKYIQPRTNCIDTYPSSNNIVFDWNYPHSGINTSSQYKLYPFDENTIIINGNTYSIDTTFGQSSPTNTIDVSGTTYYLGQYFSNGLSNPDINIKSGEIVYVDNRESVTRSSQQREDIKIILEF